MRRGRREKSRRDDMRKERNIVEKRRNVRIKIKRKNRIS